MTLRTIGQLAKAANVAVDTVRYYERVGLLERPLRQRSGWRRYSDSTLVRLQYIRRGRTLGFSLKELRTLLGAVRAGRPLFCNAFDAAVQDKIRALDRAIVELQERRAELQEFSRQCRLRRAEQRCPILESLGADFSLPAPRGHARAPLRSTSRTD